MVQPIAVATCAIRCRETPSSEARVAAMPRGVTLSAYRSASAARRSLLRSPPACAGLRVSAGPSIAFWGSDAPVGVVSTGTTVDFGMMLQVLAAS